MTTELLLILGFEWIIECKKQRARLDVDYMGIRDFYKLSQVGNVGIISNFVFLYICNFLLYLPQLMLIKAKLEINGYMRITPRLHALFH